VAKILVADDNSNIQRMVGLALKDQGIDVVAVGNGEAAVRKISELRPDLVLADVFMPVRNGYEVCEYVKQDTSLAHIPVILLVGAFDPLDEQEAQRVGADGVLKKPFVPPDPLIAMVKAALQRAGISLGPATPEKSAAPPQRKAADLLPRTPTPPPATPVSPLAGVSFSTPPAAAAPTALSGPSGGNSGGSSGGSSGGQAPFAPVIGDESFVDEPPRPEPVRIDASKHTLAFGNLLEPTTEEAADAENVRAADWRALDESEDVPEEEEEEVKESAPSWRRDGGEGAFVSEDGSGPVRDWRESAEIQVAGRQSARETWEQAEEKGGFVTAAEVPTEIGAFATELSALEVESRTVEAPEASAQEVSVPEVQAEAVPTQAEAEAPAIELADTAVAEEALAQANRDFPRTTHAAEGAAESVHESAGETAPEVAASEPVNPANEVAVAHEQPTENAAQEHHDVVEHHEEKAPESSVVNNWFSRPASPWDTDAQKMNPLAASWDTGKTAASENGASEVPAATEQGHKTASYETPTNETPSSDSQVSLEEVAAVVSDEPHAHESASHAEQSAAWHEAEMDALVSKVLARMNPDVLQTLMREILKPVVTAIVEDELRVKR
jgi:CheY-like chemotaxis protein